MRNSGLLVALTFVGSVMSWWPTGAFYVPFWIPLGCITLGMCLSMALANDKWLWPMLAAGLGTFAGINCAAILWPPGDPIAGPYVPIVAAALAIALMVFGLLVGLLLRKWSIASTVLRRTMWVVVLGWVVIGLGSLALSPTLIQRRIVNNDRLAAERFTALKDAIERAVRTYGVTSISDGMALAPHYFGTPFSSMRWKHSVREDGYRFTIHVAQGGGYIISVMPLRENLDGTRQFCADESGTTGCRMEWNGSRNVCLPCAK